MPRRDADLAAELAGDRPGQVAEVGVVHEGQCSRRSRTPRRTGRVTLPPSSLERVDGEAGQPDLGGARVVPARVGAEVGGEALRERGEPLHALLAVVERRACR